mmetsp:Transcript_32058/g.99003  ORF Transcript_32058/g.99003 Transcript_32058/m.99003 type:complete len:105 (+) Transcript_32058:2583-2897(+)
MKRLDDSSDNIRLNVCSTFSALIRVAGPDLLSGTALEYCAEHFLVHLDDKNADIQKAIFRTLEVLVAHNPSVVDVLSKKLCPIGTSHRDLRLVGRLLPRHSPYG